MVIGALLFFNIIPLFPTSSQSTLCAQSILPCPGSTTYIDSALFTNSPTPRAINGVWGGNPITSPGLITSTSGTLKVYYILSSGASVKASSLKYNRLIGPFTPITPLTSGTDNYATWFGTTSINTVLTTVGQTVQFQASLLDSLGINSTYTFSFKLLPATSPVVFQAFDATPPVQGANGAPLAGVQIVVSTVLQPGAPQTAVGTFTTDSTGTTTANLPPNQYQAIVNAPSGYVTSGGTCNVGSIQQTLWVTSGATTFTVGGSAQRQPFTFIKGSPNQCTGGTYTVTVTAVTLIQFCSGTSTTTTTTTASTASNSMSSTTTTTVGSTSTLTNTASTCITITQPTISCSNNCTVASSTTQGGDSSSTTSPSCQGLGTNAAILILVSDKSTSKPIQSATVTGGGSSQATNKGGYACLSGLPVPGGTVVNGYAGSIAVTVIAGNYTSQTVPVNIQGGQTASQVVQMVPNRGGGFGGFGILNQFVGGGLILVGVGGFIRSRRGR